MKRIDFPIGTKQGIGEASLADLIEALDRFPAELAPCRPYWISSIRQIAGFLGLPPETLPARLTALSGRIARLHPDALGVNRKTFANHRANLRAALNWFRGESTSRRVELTPEHQNILKCFPVRHDRDVLAPFLRFLRAKEIHLREVGDARLDAYAQFRAESQFRPLRATTLRKIARLWSRLAAKEPTLELRPLDGPRQPTFTKGPALNEFPERLIEDIETYLEIIAKPHRDANGRRRRGCARTTLEMRRREIVASARAAVAAGVPIGQLSSMRALLEPATAEKILEHYWTQNGKEPRTFTIELAGRFVSIAKLMKFLSEDDVQLLEDHRHTLEQYRPLERFTEKNFALVRRVLAPGVWVKVRDLPRAMLERARAERFTKPILAATSAQMAVAIRILVMAPIRIKNLGSIRLEENLVRSGGPGSRYRLTFDEHVVKNRLRLEIPLDEETTRIIDEYIDLHRPSLMRGRNHNCLFPGTRAEHKLIRGLGDQIKKRLWKELGLEMTPHQFRHAAGAIYLRHNPGDFETLSRILGHRSSRITVQYYSALQGPEAARRFGELINDLIEE